MSEPTKRRPRVLISVPNGRAWIHKLVVFAVIRMLKDQRFESTFIAPTHQPYVNNLHLVTRDFLAGDFDYLLTMDDDNPPQQNPLDLVKLDLDIVGCPTPVWYCDTKNAPGDRPFYLNALRQVVDDDGSLSFKPLDAEPGFVAAGLKRADAVGTGCLLIARRVLAELIRRCKESGDPMDAPFMRRWSADGVVELGNDYAFCERARAAGFEVWAHFDYTCEHVNELPLVESINAMMDWQQG